MEVECIKGFIVNGLSNLVFVKGNIYPLKVDSINKKEFVMLDDFQVSYQHCRECFKLIIKN